MNILVTSAGRRVKIIQYFKGSLAKVNGKVIAADCDQNAPAIYFADEKEVIPSINNENYLTALIEVCKKHSINAIISLLDPELEVLARHKELFDEINVNLILSPLDTIKYSYDKQQTFEFLTERNVPSIPTFSSIEKVKKHINVDFTYPLVVKPKKGSASIGIEVVQNEEELVNTFEKEDNLIIQPFFREKEFGIDVYIDLIEGHLVDLFIKKKLYMRSGETDKSISVHNKQIERLVVDFISKTNYKGPIDIDCFEYKGKYYISEINPRFGGGYPHAFEAGINFMDYIVNNLKGEVNPAYKSYKYKNSLTMMKYDNLILKEGV